MGFWHTGYIEFHEVTGLPEDWVPEPIRYRCALCDSIFETNDALRRHRFESHTMRRPALWIRGSELGTTQFRITRPLVASDVTVAYAQNATIRGTPVEPDDVGRVLEGIYCDRVIVTLESEGVAATFDIRFDIASDKDVEGVELAFWELARRKRLDVRSVEDFIAAASAFPTAAGYSHGIAVYLFGVLVKEGAAGIHINAGGYVAKYEEATESLRSYDRPLARMIRALVAFHFNHFAETAITTSAGLLRNAASRLAAWVRATRPPAAGSSRESSFETVLADEKIQRVLDLCRKPVGSGEISPSSLVDAIAGTTTELDRMKFQLILAEHLAATGDRQGAIKVARELRHVPALSVWSDWLLNRMSTRGSAR